MSATNDSDENEETSLSNTPQTNVPSTSTTSRSRRSFLGKVTAATVAAGLVGLPKFEGAAQVDLNCPVGCEEGPIKGVTRADAAYQRRVNAAAYERNMPIPTHPCNGDEAAFGASLNFFASYSKGMPHPSTFGEVDSTAYCTYKRALASGKPSDFELVPLGCGACTSTGSPQTGTSTSDAESRLSPPEASATPRQRRLQNPQAGYNFDLEGKDYHQLINRNPNTNTVAFPPAFKFRSDEEAVEIVENYWQVLTRDVAFIDYNNPDPTVQQAANELNSYGALYKGPKENGVVTPKVYSRGILTGDTIGPFLSQFFLRTIPYGAQSIDPKIKSPLQTNSNNFMTQFSEWLSIQNGCTPTRMTQFDSTRRYVRSGRDLAEYVHNDAIYQAYLNTALIMMTPQSMGGLEVPLDPNNPYRAYCRQDNFVEFGPSQLLTLLGEVSVRAHKAVWYQKWQVHRRIRPEEFGARVHFWKTDSTARQRYLLSTLLDSSTALAKIFATYGTYFLPQAFPEGSPLHPSYGAGHATLAGACATILKAWFDESQAYANFAQPYQPSRDGLTLVPYNGTDVPQMTIKTEL
ncbi:MAG TPA: twin-arginine translocation signal domain-containing protein, partial [Pyrinomonadaceae bacterium]